MVSATGRTVFLGLGSNIGDRVGWIRAAISGLGKLGRVVATSSLVESPPWTPPGWTNGPQPHYVNGACALATTLPPVELLREVKALEARLGRAPGVRYNARTIDIDLLAFSDGSTLDYDGDGDAFVLTPLAEIAPALVHPQLGRTILQLRDALSAAGEAPLPRVAGIGRAGSATRRESAIVWQWGRRSYLMGVLNVTPDSFSDGGDLASLDVARRAAARMVADGADVLDIGGVSTRPGAAAVPREAELERVIPLLELLRADGLEIPISVDTSCAYVARVAVDAGADLINDVSAGGFDSEMHRTVAECGVAYVAMHTRADPATMDAHANYGGWPGSVVDAVCAELGGSIARAAAAGVPRFDLIVDPGIGFAKRSRHNLELLRALRDVREKLGGLPLLLGASRKRFIGELVGEAEPKRRDWGTAAVTAAAVPYADIHRVHDVRAMRQVLALADVLRRDQPSEQAD
jgi:dihydropteroate synthase/2-amino-4-hydroxy-6-hydroxymethyldihydropteridine diphosphokinase